MGTVYLVYMKGVDSNTVISVFDSREKANKYVEIQESIEHGCEFYIEAWKVK